MIDIIKELTVRDNFTVSNLTKEMSMWVKENTKHLDKEISLKERVYILINSGSEAICLNGNRKNFKSYKQGYKFCGSAKTCKCFRDNSALFMSDFMKNMDEKELVRRVDKIKETVTNRYGVENVFQREEIKQKSKDTNKEKYGVEYSSQSLSFKENVSNTVMKKYGVYNVLKNNDIKQQIKNTNIERYGTENPLKNIDILNKVKITNLERYGFESSLLNEDVKEKIKNTNIERYGVENIWEIQKPHISSDTYKILKNIEKFKEHISKNSRNEMARNLGICNTTISKYCRLYDIELPSSSYEIAICSFLKQNNITHQLHNRQLIKPLEIDIVIHDHKIGIEFCGLYWHSEINKIDKKYHLSKLQKVNAAGYRLITIFEDEWLYKRDIVELKLLNLFGLGEKEDSEKLSIKQIPLKDSKEFLEKYHIEGVGTTYGYVGYGAYESDELVGVMTFSRKKNNELVRFAYNGKNYHDMASHLLKSFIMDYNPKQIISHVDRRWCEDVLFTQLGFEKIEESNVNYWYVKGNQRHNRCDFNKIKIENLVEDVYLKTERHIMEELGYSRIWDCGMSKLLLRT